MLHNRKMMHYLLNTFLSSFHSVEKKIAYIFYSAILFLYTKGSRRSLAPNCTHSVHFEPFISSFSVMPKERVLASLDIGSSKIRTVVAIAEGGQDRNVPNVMSVGLSPSLGIRKGQVIDVEELINNIISSLEDAERMAGVPVNHVFVGLSGSHIESFDSRGVIAISGSEITVHDVARVLEAAQAVSIPPNRRILHIEPKAYPLAEQRGLKNPVGL